MPADPIEFRIIQNLLAALQAITVAGGYHYTVAATAVKLDPNQGIEALIAPGGPRPFVLIEVTPETWQYWPASQVELALPVKIHWVSESTPTDDASRLQTYWRGCADVEKTIAVDISRGGLATDTRITQRTLETVPDGSEVWAAIDVAMKLHRTYGQPNG
jgi:hypothetical protein